MEYPRIQAGSAKIAFQAGGSFPKLVVKPMKFILSARIALILGLSATGAWLRAAEVDLSKLPAPSDKKGITYGQDIRPLLEASCTRCHSGEKPKAGLRLDNLEAALKGGKDGKVIVPGKSKESPLVIAVSQLDEEKAMPPKFRPGRRGPGGPGGGPGGPGGGPGGPPPGQPGAGGPPGGGPPHNFGPPPKPLTPEQVGLVRAWIDQGAK